MQLPHKHTACIKAWADGAPIQMRSHDGSEWLEVPAPTWNVYTQYRIRPVARKYRVAEFKSLSGDTFVSLFDTQAMARCAETTPSFIRWLTEWVEYV